MMLTDGRIGGPYMATEFYAKVYRLEGEMMVAACDRTLRGKTFEDGRLVLDVKKEFYGDEIFGREGISPLLKEATIANLVGEEIIAHAVKLGIVEMDHVLWVDGVPHAQMVRA